MSSSAEMLPEAVIAFDRMAAGFDEQFGNWASVAAQRRAVRRYLVAAFPRGCEILELGGGTGGDAIFLAREGRHVVMTDGAPRMVEKATEKVRIAGVADRVTARRLTLEALSDMPDRWSGGKFDGAYSNFASFNCVAKLESVAAGLARLIRRGGGLVLVVFGPWSVGEVVLHLARGRFKTAFRRFTHEEVRAKVGGSEFGVRYWRPRQYVAAFAPCFRLVRRRGVGIFVPPSAAEPAISRHPRLVNCLELLDRAVSAPLALLGDHVLLHFERTAVPPSRASDG